MVIVTIPCSSVTVTITSRIIRVLLILVQVWVSVLTLVLVLVFCPVGKHDPLVVMHLPQQLGHQRSLAGVEGCGETEHFFQEVEEDSLREEECTHDEGPNKQCGNLEQKKKERKKEREREILR